MWKLRYAIIEDEEIFNPENDEQYEKIFATEDEYHEWMRSQFGHPFLYLHEISLEQVA